MGHHNQNAEKPLPYHITPAELVECFKQDGGILKTRSDLPPGFYVYEETFTIKIGEKFHSVGFLKLHSCPGDYKQITLEDGTSIYAYFRYRKKQWEYSLNPPKKGLCDYISKFRYVLNRNFPSPKISIGVVFRAIRRKLIV